MREREERKGPLSDQYLSSHSLLSLSLSLETPRFPYPFCQRLNAHNVSLDSLCELPPSCTWDVSTNAPELTVFCRVVGPNADTPSSSTPPTTECHTFDLDGHPCVVHVTLYNAGTNPPRSNVDGDAAAVFSLLKVGAVQWAGPWMTDAIRRVALRAPSLQQVRAAPFGPLPSDLFQHCPNLTVLDFSSGRGLGVLPTAMLSNKPHLHTVIFDSGRNFQPVVPHLHLLLFKVGAYSCHQRAHRSPLLTAAATNSPSS
jgi:hypothetical protein